MTTVVIVVAVVLVALVAIAVLRSRTRRPQLAAPVAPLPEVLVEAEAPRPSLEEPGSLRQRLATSRGVFDRLRSITGDALSSEQREVVEEVLLRSDIGVATTTAVLDELDAGIPLGVAGEVRRVLLGFLDRDRAVRLVADPGRVPVWLFVGVNGVGKTTTIGKLAQLHADQGRRVVLAAGDTFRAAAADQLAQWAERADADIVRAAEGADPGSVIHDALGRAAARQADIVLADTAGRRANNTNLLDELRKVRRVADREPGQVVETLLVLDATTGQNALSQAREFLAAAEVTGIVLTKLDGTARGGIVVAIERELGIPVKYVGVGERVEDLRVFEPEAFVDSLLAT
ncbi:MAG TPA: signal recognition particle-docking protein FtsY [Acidimicrobiales bacterium]|nr:signal recognition particle-docking protein FtsY [Acidimicrobiales bacterium]